MAKKDMTWEAAILEILKTQEAPISYREIAQQIVNKELRSQDRIGHTPSASVNVVLHHQLANKVISVGRGDYILKTKWKPNTNIVLPSQKEDYTEDEENIDDDLITAYGRFWSRNLFEANQNNLYGVSAPIRNANCADFSNMPGIYLLHKGYEVIYVGKADKLVTRLKAHLNDDKRNRWDNFSWFSIQKLHDNSDEGEKVQKEQKTLSHKSVLDTLEALLIEIIGPARNKQLGNHFEDKEFEQITAENYFQKKYNNK